MATPLNPERISPLTGETLTSEKIYWIHVRQAQEIEAAQEPSAPITLFTLSHRGAGWYDIIKDGEAVDSVRGKEEAEAKIEALNANTDQGNE